MERRTRQFPHQPQVATSRMGCPTAPKDCPSQRRRNCGLASEAHGLTEVRSLTADGLSRALSSTD